MALLLLFMKYFYQKPNIYGSVHGQLYICKGGWYTRATLFLHDGKGLCVVQQRFEPVSCTCAWRELDPWLAQDIYRHPGFERYFLEHAGECVNGLYPVVQVRKIMWALRMKPLPKEFWEEYF